MNFRLKKPDLALNSKIFFFFVRGLSNRQISRTLELSEECVRNRLSRMSRQAFLFHARKTEGLSIGESIAFDGLENFAASQYDPNNINHAIGYHSLFIYDFNFAPLNRKGRMSPWQRRRLRHIEARQGRYDPSALRHRSREIFKRMAQRSSKTEPLHLLTDEHFQYRRALREIKTKKPVIHKTVSSRACRNFQNILFSVNHTDLMLRQRVAAFSRETISFAKTAARMCQKYALYMVYKNYMVPQFTKKHVRRPRAHEESPAQTLGLTKGLLGFGEIFDACPRPKAASDLNDEWRAYYEGRVPKACLRSKKFARRAR